jgi:hypothetical protein
MTGIGVGVFILLVISIVGFIRSKKTVNRIAIYSMLVFGIYAVFSNWFPISFIPTRMWVYMSLPLASIVSVSLVFLFKGNDMRKAFGFMIFAVILLTSLYPKVYVNLHPWGNARFNSEPEYRMLVYLNSLPIGTKVYDACMYERIWGLNLWDDPLDKEAILYKNKKTNVSVYGWDSEGWVGVDLPEDASVFSENVNDVGRFLGSKNYEYIIVGSKCVSNEILFWKEFDLEIATLENSSLFEKTFDYKGEYIFKLVSNNA